MKPHQYLTAATLALGVLIAGSGCEQNITDRDIEFIETAEVRRLSLNAEGNPRAVLFVDPRAPASYAEGHLPRAMNIELVKIEIDGGRKKWIEAYSDIVVYGDDPGSAVARAVTKRLLRVGYDEVRMYSGGMLEWRKAGFPVETGANQAANDGDKTPAPVSPNPAPANTN